MTFIAYRITNSATGAAYIGITRRSLKARWAGHLHSSKTSQTPLYRAMRKYGLDVFAVEHIASATDYDSLRALEVALIEQERTHISVGGYNVTLGGDGTLGWVPSQETRDAIRAASRRQMAEPGRREALSDAVRRQWSDPEFHRAMCDARKGRVITPEWRSALSKAGKGRVHTPEALEKQAAKLRGRARPPEIMEKVRLSNIGRKRTEHSIQAQRDAWEARRRASGQIHGVYPNGRGKWRVRFHLGGGLYKNIGIFGSKDEAISAAESYKNASRDH